MHDLFEQLEMFGVDGARRMAETASTSARERSRLLRRIDVMHELMSELPAGEDLSFMHSGLCQTCLPHSRPVEDHAVWAAQVRTILADGAAWCVRSRRRRPVCRRPQRSESTADPDPPANRRYKVPHGQPRRVVQRVYAEPRFGGHWRQAWHDRSSAGAVPSHLPMQLYDAMVGRHIDRSSDCCCQHAHRRPVGVVEFR